MFFPGHVPASDPELSKEFEKAGFRVTHTSCHDYRKTLRQWFEGLVARPKSAVKIVDVTTYNRYVVFFAASYKYFDERTGVLFRFVLSKPPITGQIVCAAFAEVGGVKKRAKAANSLRGSVRELKKLRCGKTSPSLRLDLSSFSAKLRRSCRPIRGAATRTVFGLSTTDGVFRGASFLWPMSCKGLQNISSRTNS